MNSQTYLQTYKNVERQSAAESEDPHAMIGALFDELVKRMQTFSQNLNGDEAALHNRNECYGRSLAILHALQSCLDFEQGGEVAENLFRLYEFARQQLLESFRSGNPERINLAITSLVEIRDAWRMMDNTAKITPSATGGVS